MGLDHDKMKEQTSIEGKDLGVGFILSIGMHVVLVVLLIWWIGEADDPVTTVEEEEEEESMEVVLDDDEPWEEPPAPPAPEEEAPQEVVEEEEEIEEVEPDDQQRYAVEQESDDEVPDEADHISEEAHATEEETVAEETTLEDVEIPEETESEEQQREVDREMAMEAPEEESEQEEIDDDEIAEDERDDDADAEAEEEEARAFRDPSEMMEPDQQMHGEVQEADREAIFGSDSERREAVLEEGQEGREGGGGRQGRRLLSNWRENEEAMRASLENFVPHIQPGNHTSVNAYAAPHAEYIARLHREIHPKWAEGFVPRVSRAFSSRHEVNDPTLETVIEIVIDANEEKVVETGRVQPSGVEIFDAEALNITRNLERVDNPPESMVSPDGKIYLHWTFWRDQRLCGTFGAQIFEREAGG